MKYMVLFLFLTSCSRFETNHSADPVGCRERTAQKIAYIYPNPNNLHTAIDAICGDGIDPSIPTTTRDP